MIPIQTSKNPFSMIDMLSHAVHPRLYKPNTLISTKQCKDMEKNECSDLSPTGLGAKDESFQTKLAEVESTHVPRATRLPSAANAFTLSETKERPARNHLTPEQSTIPEHVVSAPETITSNEPCLPKENDDTVPCAPYEFLYCTSYGGLSLCGDALEEYQRRRVAAGHDETIPSNASDEVDASEDDLLTTIHPRRDDPVLLQLFKDWGAKMNNRHCKFALGSVPMAFKSFVRFRNYDGKELPVISGYQYLQDVLKQALDAHSTETDAQRLRKLRVIVHELDQWKLPFPIA